MGFKRQNCIKMRARSFHNIGKTFIFVNDRFVYIVTALIDDNDSNNDSDNNKGEL